MKNNKNLCFALLVVTYTLKTITTSTVMMLILSLICLLVGSDPFAWIVFIGVLFFAFLTAILNFTEKNLEQKIKSQKINRQKSLGEIKK